MPRPTDLSYNPVVHWTINGCICSVNLLRTLQARGAALTGQARRDLEGLHIAITNVLRHDDALAPLPIPPDVSDLLHVHIGPSKGG